MAGARTGSWPAGREGAGALFRGRSPILRPLSPAGARLPHAPCSHRAPLGLGGAAGGQGKSRAAARGDGLRGESGQGPGGTGRAPQGPLPPPPQKGRPSREGPGPPPSCSEPEALAPRLSTLILWPGAGRAGGEAEGQPLPVLPEGLLREAAAWLSAPGEVPAPPDGPAAERRTRPGRGLPGRGPSVGMPPIAWRD